MKNTDDMYNYIESLSNSGETVKSKVLKSEYAMNWKKYLENSELLKYYSLSESMKIMIEVSLDPFNALKNIIEEYHDER